ncbi:hypothetical protein MKK67_28060 [Methylobacterium sp. J-072]|uniref:hypothetical protein n=1 Tax=Methylobacterium sp. J-072 TaxID=2836651 RepID=UPI001FB95A77|nr:hypothetical protein [Methylobacterium sp. J-072]MCJ2096327.1 hypothetical protein [Methylobacterium sp. J-072]
MARRKAADQETQSASADAAAARIGNEGRRVSAQRKLSTRERCEAAMRDIQADVEANKGIYPLSDGRITLQEVLRRAGLSSAALEKRHHHDFKAEVADWVAGANKRIARGARTIRKVVTERVDEANAEIKAIRQAWTEAELEYVDGRGELAKLTTENAALARQVQQLQAELAGRNVIPMTGAKDPR